MLPVASSLPCVQKYAPRKLTLGFPQGLKWGWQATSSSSHLFSLYWERRQCFPISNCQQLLLISDTSKLTQSSLSRMSASTLGTLGCSLSDPVDLHDLNSVKSFLAWSSAPLVQSSFSSLKPVCKCRGLGDLAGVKTDAKKILSYLSLTCVCCC